MHRKRWRVGVGGHDWELGTPGVSSARANEEERASRDGAEPRKATAPTFTSYTNFVLNVSVDVRVHGLYAVSDVCYIVVHVLTLNSALTFVPFQVPFPPRGTRMYRVRRQLRVSRNPFCHSDEEYG